MAVVSWTRYSKMIGSGEQGGRVGIVNFRHTCKLHLNLAKYGMIFPYGPGS